MNFCRHTPPVRCFTLLIATACLQPSSAAQSTITRLPPITVSGNLRSVEPGMLVIVTDAGKTIHAKIQGPDSKFISLDGSRASMKLPPDVKITGEISSESLQAGNLVRCETLLNGLGNSKQKVAAATLLDDGAAKPGVAFVKQPASRRAFAMAKLVGRVVKLGRDRLTLDVGQSSAVSHSEVNLRLADDVRIQVASASLRRIGAGDKVVSAELIPFSNGEYAVASLEVQLGTHEREDDAEVRLLRKYERLSDKPTAPREERSPHFLLHTDVSPRSAAILLERLETMLALVSKYFGRPPTQGIECYVVADLKQWPEGAIPPAGMAKIASKEGVTLSRSLGRQRRSIVYCTDSHGVVQHEAVHAYCYQTFGSTGPTWYSEGMAEMGHYWKQGELAVHIDPVATDLLRNGKPKAMLDIVATGQITGDSYKAYCWRWALCYLLANNPNYSGRFKALGIAMMSGDQANFESVYGGVAQEISFEYGQFVKHVRNGYRADLVAWQWGRKFAPVGRRPRRIKVEAAAGWQASGVRVEGGVAYQATAEGEWEISPLNKKVTAAGTASAAGRLEGVVMSGFKLGKPIKLGEQAKFTPEVAGDLYLRCGDAWNELGDNTGQVTVSVSRADN